MRRHSLFTLVLLFILSGAVRADQPLFAMHGTVEKADKDGLSVRPRGETGKFEKAVPLKLTGTSRVSTVTVQTRSGKMIVLQRDTDVKDLQPGQSIAVVYTKLKEDAILLSAVVDPTAK